MVSAPSRTIVTFLSLSLTVTEARVTEPLSFTVVLVGVSASVPFSLSQVKSRAVMTILPPTVISPTVVKLTVIFVSVVAVVGSTMTLTLVKLAAKTVAGTSKVTSIAITIAIGSNFLNLFIPFHLLFSLICFFCFPSGGFWLTRAVPLCCRHHPPLTIQSTNSTILSLHKPHLPFGTLLVTFSMTSQWVKQDTLDGSSPSVPHFILNTEYMAVKSQPRHKTTLKHHKKITDFKEILTVALWAINFSLL